MNAATTQQTSKRAADDSGEVPPGYKRTEVGVIPEEWDHACIADIAQVRGGKRLPSGYSLVDTPTPHPYVRVTDMYHGGVALSDIRYVPEQAFPPIQRYRVYSEDIFISVAGTLGIVGVVPNELSGANLTENADRITGIQCERDYLKYWLMSQPIQQTIEAIRTVGAQPKLALGRIAKFDIPLPRRRSEQRAIAEALSDVDGLLGALEALIAKKRAIKQAAMQQLLTGKTRLPGFSGAAANDSRSEAPNDWRRMPLHTISSMHGRIGWQGLKQTEFTTETSDPFLITGVDFRDSGIDWDSAYHVSRDRYNVAPQIQLRPADVLMTKDGTIGKLLYVESIPYPGMATLNSHLLVLRPVKGAYVPRFLFYQLSSRRFAEHIEQHKSGSTFFGLSQAATGRFVVLLPSIQEQQAIATVLSDMDAEIAALEARRDKTRAIKQGMMQQLLTGRVRLVKPEAAA